LRVVHEAVLATADAPLGHVVSGDFLYDQIAANLVSTAQLPKEVFENVQRFSAGDADAQLKAKLLKLIYLINKLPADAALDIGLKATEEALADLWSPTSPRAPPSCARSCLTCWASCRTRTAW
jgi:hypothetical protein